MVTFVIIEFTFHVSCQTTLNTYKYLYLYLSCLCCCRYRKDNHLFYNCNYYFYHYYRYYYYCIQFFNIIFFLYCAREMFNAVTTDFHLQTLTLPQVDVLAANTYIAVRMQQI